MTPTRLMRPLCVGRVRLGSPARLVKPPSPAQAVHSPTTVPSIAAPARRGFGATLSVRHLVWQAHFQDRRPWHAQPARPDFTRPIGHQLACPVRPVFIAIQRSKLHARPGIIRVPCQQSARNVLPDFSVPTPACPPWRVCPVVIARSEQSLVSLVPLGHRVWIRTTYPFHAILAPYRWVAMSLPVWTARPVRIVPTRCQHLSLVHQ